MKLGDNEVFAIETGTFALDGGAMFGVVPKNLWARTNPPDEQNRIAMALRVMLIRRPDATILVDTGMGTKYDEKTRQIYKLNNHTHTLLSSLASRGLAPEDITHVIQTHLHFDHCGGSVSVLGNGELGPTFPNARYYVQKENLKWARNPTDKDRASYLPNDWEPLAANGMLHELDGPGEFMPGIELMIFNGHTRAQQLVHVHGKEGHLFFCADLMPTKAHLHLPFIMGYDNFPLTTLEEKKSLLPRMHEERWHLFFEHDPDSAVTGIERTHKGFTAGEHVAL